MHPETPQERNQMIYQQLILNELKLQQGLIPQLQDYRYRISLLKSLYEAIRKHQDEICHALEKDLHKSPFESYTCEVGIVLGEIRHHIKLVKKMRKPQKVSRSLFTLNGKSRIQYQPIGKTLIISPWNYPFHLCLMPLVGAIAAGNWVTLKLSPLSTATNQVIKQIVSEAFPKHMVIISEGHREVNTFLLSQEWNHIFFTGSPAMGRVVMESASKYLAKVTLELGGKSPCIVNKDADIEMAAKRIVFGKLINAGQTCIAPDHLWVHSSVKEALIRAMIKHIEQSFGKNAQESPHYPRIISEGAMERLVGYLNNLGQGKLIYGGDYNLAQKYIQPTLVEGLDSSHELLNREIFGPIMPVREFDNLQEVIDHLADKPRPLALYYFGKNKKEMNFLLQNTHCGGVCINDTLMHIVNANMPFGGNQNSGLGHYHGKYSYECFSHQKAILKTSNKIDFWFRYPPFSDFWLKMVKKIMK